jgi:adenine-specific DNA methylase
VKYWGHWILEKARKQIDKFYPRDSDGGLPVAYLWAKTVRSPDPTVNAHIPLVRQLWLCKKRDRNVALKITPNRYTQRCEFTIVEGEAIDFDPDEGTMRRGDATCPFTGTVASVAYLREQARLGKMNQQLMAVVSVVPGRSGKQYRPATTADEKIFEQATVTLADLRRQLGDGIIPNEPIIKNARGQISPPIWGIETWGALFNSRQLLALATLSAGVKDALTKIEQTDDSDYAKAIATYLGLALSRFADFSSSLCLFNYTGGRGVKNTFARQALPMVWDYAESAPFNPQGANWEASIEAACGVIEKVCFRDIGNVSRGTASRLSMGDKTLEAVITDPPYYDAVPYSDLSDFFYVWQKRTLADFYPNDFRTPLTPKAQEAIQAAQRHKGDRAAAARAYEGMIAQAFQEVCRVLSKEGIVCVMFAHKTTSAWETLISGLIRSGLLVTASWPIRTEKPGRVIAQDTAALASSVTLVCRRRAANAGEGLWDDVRQELRQVAQERLDFFWAQGIRGADFFISAIGPALSVFGKYERVTKLSGEEVTVGQFLDEVRGLVTNYALAKILHTTHTAAIDPESRFYVVWRWSYGDAKVPADESFKLSQALGMHTEEMWDRTGVLEKSGENVQAIPIVKRMRVKSLGEPTADGAPASLIDVLHRMCAFREQGDTQGMAQFLGQSGHANNPTLWLVAQAISEILPDGDKEKQLMQGLLNQREGLEEATRQRTLF